MKIECPDCGVVLTEKKDFRLILERLFVRGFLIGLGLGALIGISAKALLW
jgi:hypothetical protein